MATSTRAAATAPVVGPRGNVSVDIVATLSLATGDQTLNSVHQMVKVPKNFTVTDVTLVAADLDGATAAVLAVGDTGSANRYITGSTIAQAGGMARATAGLGYTYTAASTIDVKFTTAPGTPQAGAITVIVRGIASDSAI